MSDLRGRVVVVTGGNTGIGLGLAKGVALAGADVAVWARNTERNEKAVAELRALGVEASSERCDVAVHEPDKNESVTNRDTLWPRYPIPGVQEVSNVGRLQPGRRFF